MNVLFVHGYSETSLDAYFDFPARLKAAMPAIADVALSAFNSLDDTVTIDDLSDALEARVVALGDAWLTPPCAVICHSTGALIARRWILNRIAQKRPIPTHLVTMAGANHGSTLAQMGKSVLGYFQKLLLKQSTSVGANVLTDLDYGSDFLLRLNTEWMERWNNGELDGLYAFSMGGDSIGTDPALEVFWQTHEPGSDNTVRISGANLNYTIVTATNAPGAQPVVTAPLRPVPHLVLAGYSHFGPATGILGFVNPAGDAPVAAVVDALAVADAATYATKAAAWAARTEQWAADVTAARTPTGPSLVNATAIFTLRDESGRAIPDCVIAILNKAALGDQSNAADPAALVRLVEAANSVSESIVAHSPIQNTVALGSYSFYFDFYKFVADGPHVFHAEATLPGQLISFMPLIFTQPATPANAPPAMNANQCTYVALTMKRDVDRSYALYGYGPGLDPKTTWDPMPFPTPGQIP